MSVSTNSIEQISESYNPDTVAGPLRDYVSVRQALFFFVAGGVLITGIAIGVQGPIVTGLVVYACIAGPIGIAALVSRSHRNSQAVPRKVSLADGVITITIAEETEAYTIDECCWFHGKAIDDSRLDYHPIRRNAIVVVFPTGQKVACGLADSFHAQWLSVLQNSSARRVLRQEGAVGFIFALLSLTGLAAGAFVGWHAGQFLQNAVIPQGANNAFANLIPTALAIIFGWLLALSPWLIPGWRRQTDEERNLLLRWAITTPVKIAIPAAALAVGNRDAGVALAVGLTLLFVLIIWLFTRHPKAKRITGAP